MNKKEDPYVKWADYKEPTLDGIPDIILSKFDFKYKLKAGVIDAPAGVRLSGRKPCCCCCPSGFFS